MQHTLKVPSNLSKKLTTDNDSNSKADITGSYHIERRKDANKFGRKSNLKNLIKETTNNNRYESRLAKLVANGQDVNRIKSVVENAVLNIKNDQRSFVIYGEQIGRASCRERV